MAPVVPFIPLIAAAVTAGGGIVAAKVAGNAQKKAAGLSSNSLISDPADATPSPAKRSGILPINENPLGDTSTPSLSKNKLLGS